MVKVELHLYSVRYQFHQSTLGWPLWGKVCVWYDCYKCRHKTREWRHKRKTTTRNRWEVRKFNVACLIFLLLLQTTHCLQWISDILLTTGEFNDTPHIYGLTDFGKCWFTCFVATLQSVQENWNKQSKERGFLTTYLWSIYRHVVLFYLLR